ncbi:VapE domain-containing protein [Sabulibacter ruber]|uniref:VapE domain-containing protein n=1 Tax=Sabulibacter ruber TaxID=2811901 RepID=UPI001A958B5A|nr:VapE domain-containing protein [Sabulibacter ruber]
MFSVYDSTKTKEPTRQVSLADAYTMVSTGTYRTPGDVENLIWKLRQEADKARRRQLKESLPIFTFSANFNNERKEGAPYMYSQLMCVDIDNLEPGQVTDLYEKFKAWGFTHLMFVSPSGNGLKVVFLVNTAEAQHKMVYKALMYKIRDKFGLPLKSKDFPNGLDTVCQDISRACYLSHDPQAFYDEYAPEMDAKLLLEEYSIHLQAQAGPKKSGKPTFSGSSASTPMDTVEFIVSELEARNISLSNCHAENIAIGWALLSVGADADYFHRITRLNPDYDFKRMEERYRYLAKRPTNSYSLGTLVYMATAAGVEMPEESLVTDQQYVRNWLTSQFEFRTNEISGKIEHKAAARDEAESTAGWQALSDFKLNEWSSDIKDIRIKYRDSGGKPKGRKLAISKEDVVDLIHNHKFSPAVNPVVERFGQLHKRFSFEGDPLSEVRKWFNAFEYANSQFAESFWMDWFGGVVQNLTTAGYYDKIMVLSGVGGVGKTFAIKERLCAPFSEYFTQSFTWSSNKDDLGKITKYLFILDDELNTSRKADVEQIKNITSMSHTDIREAYARLDSRRPRIANFVATTNNREFLTDLTGNRRFLVLDVVAGNRDIINSIDYDRLWAEVWEYFHEKGNTSALNSATINGNNEAFREITVEEEAVIECFDFAEVAGGKCLNENFVVPTIKDIIDFINTRTGRKFTEDARTSKKIKLILNSRGVIQTGNTRYNGRQGRWWFLRAKRQDCDNMFVSSAGGLGLDLFGN